jgi:Domain of unknown function (DUF4124)
MPRYPQAVLLAIFLLATIVPAHADVWRWVDANGNNHFVDSDQAIYTWRDDNNKVHYSDKPDHEDAIRVQLFWHSKGTLASVAKAGSAPPPSAPIYPGETAEERAQREAVVAHNCERANEILKSYENAPKLYRTDEAGNRHILTDAEHAAELADAREKTQYLCNQ